MTCAIVPFGTQNDSSLRSDASTLTEPANPVKTLTDLLACLGDLRPNKLKMLRTTAALLARYLDQSPDQVSIDAVHDAASGFSEFLRQRRYKRNSVRSYVNYRRILLAEARRLGWDPAASIHVSWKPVMELTPGRNCRDIVQAMARLRKSPKDVTIDDVDTWGNTRVAAGRAFYDIRRKKMRFWRLLRDAGCTQQSPLCLVRENRYGIPLESFPKAMRTEVMELLRWKQAPFAIDRPKGEKLRPVSAKVLEESVCALYGFVVHVRCEKDVTSLSQLVERALVGSFIEWALNTRRVNSRTIRKRLGCISAALKHHPSYQDLDLSWLRPMLDSIPIEPESEMRKRKAAKYLDYATLESIPGKIRATRPEAAKRGKRELARTVMNELLIRWLTVLPWRQRNIRECRVAGPNPNLFRGKIPAFSDLDRPKWIQDAERDDPEATFWQFHFSPEETKMGREVAAFVPRQLIGLLEDYLSDHRQHLIGEIDPGTLFINPSGGAMNLEQTTFAIGQLTHKYGGVRVTPHIFRDIIAFAWLRENPQAYLALSKVLWHSNINTTLAVYGARFNWSSGVAAMETWLEKRDSQAN